MQEESGLQGKKLKSKITRVSWRKRQPMGEFERFTPAEIEQQIRAPGSVLPESPFPQKTELQGVMESLGATTYAELIKRQATLPTTESTIEFPGRKEVNFDYKENLQAIIEAQRLRHEGSASQEKADVRIKTNLPWVLVVGSSDWHLGSESVNYSLFAKHMDLIKQTEGAYMCIVGDERDNFIIPKYASGLFEGVLNPQQQAQMVEDLLVDLDDHDKVLARVTGNHDNWTWTFSGIQLHDLWHDKLKSPLLRNGGFMDLHLNDQKYVAFLHHGISKFNSSFNPNHASKRAFEFMGPYDFMFSGHVHVSETAHSYRWMDEYAKDYVQIRTGTYKENDQYARALQLGRGQPPGGSVLLNTQEKRMIPFLKLEDGIEALKALNTTHQLVEAGVLKMGRGRWETVAEKPVENE